VPSILYDEDAKLLVKLIIYIILVADRV